MLADRSHTGGYQKEKSTIQQSRNTQCIKVVAKPENQVGMQRSSLAPCTMGNRYKTSRSKQQTAHAEDTGEVGSIPEEVARQPTQEESYIFKIKREETRRRRRRRQRQHGRGKSWTPAEFFQDTTLSLLTGSMPDVYCSARAGRGPVLP